MFATNHFTDADSVLRTLIVGIGGFASIMALLLSGWSLWSWYKNVDGKGFANLLFGLVLLSFSGLAVLTTDHIYQHLLARETAAWQLWMALTSFTVGAVALMSLLSVRFDRSSRDHP